LKNPFYTILSLIFLTACRPGGPEISGVPITQYYNNCQINEFDFGETITIGDPNDKFMITLPYEWDIQETYSDTLYGMIATNSTLAENNPEVFLLFSITGYKTTDSLLTYFSREVASLKNDKSMDVLEVGKMDFNGKDSYWVKFETVENDNTILNVVKYINSDQKNEIYLIQSSVNKTGNFDENICILKLLADSFELVE
jgi:hypothetical protein